MSLDLLDTPVRLTWDLHGGEASPSTGGMLTIAAAIAAGGVFFVTLEERPLAHPDLSAIVATLTGAGCRVQLACRGGVEELAVLARLSAPLPGVQIDLAAFLDGDRLDRPRLAAVLDRLKQLPAETLLRLTPLQSSLAALPDILEFCADHAVLRLKLSNARIGDSFPADDCGQLPRWPDLETFRRLWAERAPRLAETLQLEIHDRFLWEIMTPEREQARSEYGGCQAANSLGHVDAAGDVYACAAWPERLGSLPGQSLEEIWRSPKRTALRARIAAVPDGCCGCRDYALCLGGCRGLGELLNQSCGGRDPMCREPRR